MSRSVRFYTALGFSVRYGGEHAEFTSLHAGSSYLNLIAQPANRRWSWWGRVIFHVSDVDAFHRRALEQGLAPATAPRDAPWGERYFHISDPDGHELSFARPLERS
jgi:uncharacterized glyoxalase superfamily protein PhnB